MECLGYGKVHRALIVIDETCDKLYGDQFRAYFERYGVQTRICTLSGGETSKTLDFTLRVVDAMAGFGMMRRSQPLLCVGGGVVMDAAGFAASIYRRGIPYVRIPTTLMGIVDASVGLKTGVSYGGGKNRLGSYHAPKCVLIDTSFLETLPERELCSGAAEILKLALILEPELLIELEENTPHILLDKFRSLAGHRLIRNSIRIMIQQLSGNFQERDLNRLVDFGHSFSPYIEMRRVGEILHGEAVALDMAICIAIALRRNLLDEPFAQRVLQLFRNLNLPTINESFSAEELFGALEDVVLHRDGLQRVPLPRKDGPGLFANNIELLDVAWAVDYLRNG